MRQSEMSLGGFLRQPGPALRRRRYRSGGGGPGGRVGFVISCLERGDQRGLKDLGEDPVDDDEPERK
jgi:hypothetical protein